MEDVFTNILFGVFLLGVIVLAISLFFYYELLRHRDFIRMAAILGLRYYYRSYALHRRFSFLFQLRRGRGRHAFNILQGNRNGYEVLVFDYLFTSGMGKTKQKHYSSFVVMHHGKDCPPLRIYPRAMLEELGRIIGFDEFFFNAPEFDAKFVVFATDESFARLVCHAALVDYMLHHPDLSLEIDPHWMALGTQALLIPEEIPRRLRQLEKIRVMLPQ